MPNLHEPVLYGRSEEREALEQLLSGVGTARAQVLVIQGEAGVGKTALLEYLATNAPTYRVERAVGIESEMELAFAGVHQLCAPMLGRLGELPGPQREALGIAFGLSSGTAPDRFLVGLAVLHLFSAVAEKQPLICLIDDAQWLDRNSAQVLAFVARRLLAEPIAMVFAVREPLEELSGLPELEVGLLSDSDARSLLGSALPGRLDERVRDRIVAETRGNPLAILELPREFNVTDLAGGFGLPDPGPLANRMEESFGRRLHSLPVETQQLLLLAAAEPVGDVTLLWRAAEQLRIGVDAAEPALSAGLLEFDTRVRFRHPLVRSTAYRQAALADRQEVHRALSEATDPDVDPDRRAWHRAQAAAGPDEAVASELEQSAARAQARGGIAAAAAFLERATELTPDPARRVSRALVAAQASIEAGGADSADKLLTAAEIGPQDELQQARTTRLRAQILFARRRGNDAPPLYLDAARQLEPLDGYLARETYLEALGSAIFAGRLSSHTGTREAAEAARNAPPGPEPPRPTDLLLDGVATRFTDGYETSVTPLREALLTFRQQSEDHIMGWLWLGCPVAPEPVAPELWDDQTWHELATRAVALAREEGALAVLPVALTYRASVHLHAGEFAAAAALIEEADAISGSTGQAPLRYTSMLLAAWQGEATPTLKLIESDVKDATARGEGRAVGLASYATALLYNGLGRYEAALAAAQRSCEHEDLGFFGWSLIELVEAGVRSGATELASAAFSTLQDRTNSAGTDWALGSQARSQALLTEGDAAESHYLEAIERLERTRIKAHLARSHLVYGEWLRRENRRVDARAQLRKAYDMFNRMGAQAFAERARRELVATGETVRKRSVETRFLLTAQESQVAHLASEGHTNPEIGSQLFISPRTVEYHLHKVFAKLGINSRRELRRTLQSAT
ncbi:MAG: helix-turn-helix transcriptional regulator [Acidimicrobiia bacterium]